MNMIEFGNATLSEISVEISKRLVEEKRKQEKYKQNLQERKALYERQYIAANTGDSSENAPLDEAKKNLRTITGEIASNLTVLQAMENLEDDYFVRRTFDFSELEDAIHRLEEPSLSKIIEVFPGLTTNNIRDYFIGISIDNLVKGANLFHAWIKKNKNEQHEQQCFNKLSEYYNVANMPPYNACGLVKPYSTVRLEKKMYGVDPEELIIKIYPDGLSFLDIGIIASNSRVAQAILDKEVGDVVAIQHSSRKLRLEYTIKEIY